MASTAGIKKRVTRIQKKTGMGTHEALQLAIKRAKNYSTTGQTDAGKLKSAASAGRITSGQARKTIRTLKRTEKDPKSPQVPGYAPRKSYSSTRTAKDLVAEAVSRREDARTKKTPAWSPFASSAVVSAMKRKGK